MAKIASTQFVCQSCGEVHSKWAGRCANCGAWNTLVEEAVSAPPGSLKPQKSGTRASTKATFTALD
ncbi:MAG: DNA repair protein RadA, partial [Pseudomonadota bacterium]